MKIEEISYTERENIQSDAYGSVDIYSFECPTCNDSFKLSADSYIGTSWYYDCKCNKTWYIRDVVVAYTEEE